MRKLLKQLARKANPHYLKRILSKIDNFEAYLRVKEFQDYLESCITLPDTSDGKMFLDWAKSSDCTTVAATTGDLTPEHLERLRNPGYFSKREC